MEMTDEADPTMTRPMTQSRPESASSTVETASCLPPIRTPVPGRIRLRAGPRCGRGRPRRGAPSLGVDRPCRWFAVVVTPAPPHALPHASARARAPPCPVRPPMHGPSLPHRAAEVAEGHVNFATVRKSP